MKAEEIADKELFGQPLKVDEVKYRYQKFEGGMSDEVTNVIVKRSDAIAAIVYHTDMQQYIFARQFRYCAMGQDNGWLTEIVAGVIDEGETHGQALHRELEEELGYKAEKVEKIVSFYTAPGYSTEQVHLYYVEVSNSSKQSQGGGLADENEDIQPVYYTIDEINAILSASGFNDAKTIIGCFYLLNRSIV